jgi:hypothetical protein
MLIKLLKSGLCLLIKTYYKYDFIVFNKRRCQDGDYSDKNIPNWPNTIVKNGFIRQLSRNPLKDHFIKQVKSLRI